MHENNRKVAPAKIQVISNGTEGASKKRPCKEIEGMDVSSETWIHSVSWHYELYKQIDWSMTRTHVVW